MKPVEIRGLAWRPRLAVYRMVRGWGDSRRKALRAALLAKRIEVEEVEA